MCSGCVIDAGHTKIGILGGDIEKSYTSHQRFIGIAASFLEHDTVFVPEKSYEKARFSYDSAYRGIPTADRRCPDITAVFAMSDVMAIGAIRALRDLEYRVPEDVSDWI